MSKTLTYAASPADAALCLILRGALNEYSVAVLREVGGLLSGPTVFDLQGIESVNSCGLAEWMLFVERYCRGKTVSLLRCSPVVVNCLNLSGGFAAGTQVASIMVPFRCRQDHPQLREVAVRDAASLRSASPPQLCAICRKTADPDVDLEDYLSFLDD